MILANIIESAFRPLIWLFLQVLLGVHSAIGGSWGWAIIGLTVIVRTATFPLTRSQFKNIAKMRVHAPELQKIQKRYKDDRQRLAEAQMKYYKEAGLNPFAACLPIVLQLPVFISLVYMLRTDLPKHICSAARSGNAALVHVQCALAGTTATGAHAAAITAANDAVAKHAGFLFVSNITSKATGAVLVVLMVLYVGTQVFSGAMMSVGTDKRQRMMAIGLPFVFVLFVVQFAAGLLIYWTATNITMIPQQLYMLRKYGRPNVPVVVDGKEQSNGRGSPSEARDAVRTPAAKQATKPPASPPPSARQRTRRKRSGRRR